MSSIETIAMPVGNRISVDVPEEYSSCLFQVLLVPLRDKSSSFFRTGHRGRHTRQRNFVEALLSCPKLPEGETLDISRDSADFGRDVDL